MSTALPVLVAEDEETDILLLRLAWERAMVPNPLVVAHDGQEMIDYLSGKPPFVDRASNPLPALLVVDLKMPRMNGFDVLAWLSRQPVFKELPAVILSSSSYPADIENAKRMGAQEYFVKPHNFHDLVKVVQNLSRRFLAESKPTAAT